ncbi:MAG: hypothetical protein M0C28_42220 [Candidatus Moduliflexus flocculans]|nr:hypothetical protein [Candidatus Moduliflexus flocculans]
MSNLELAFDFEGLTLFWLGKAPEDTQPGPGREALRRRPATTTCARDLHRGGGLSRDAGARRSRSLAGILGGGGDPTSCARTRRSGSASRTTPRACGSSPGRPVRTDRKRSARAPFSPSARSSSRRPSTRSSPWPGAPRNAMSGSRPSFGWARWLRRSPAGRSRSSP